LLLNPLVRRTLAPRGQTPFLLQRGRHRQKVSLIAGLTISPRRARLGLYFRSAPDEYFKQDSVAGFVRQVLRHIRGRVILVWDRWSGHRGKAIRALRAANPRLELVDLPPYAPDLNPVEFLWTHLKWNELANFAPDDSAHLNETLLPILKGITRDPERIRSFWHGAKLKLPRRRLTT
jgi:transposase